MVIKTIRSLVIVLVSINLFFALPFSNASTLKKLSLEDLTRHADTIIVGKCEKTECIWLAKKIYTVATIRIQESIKGQKIAKQAIPVYILGGRVKKPLPLKMYVPGAPKISPGEEMILFLKKYDGKSKAKTNQKEPKPEIATPPYFRIVGMAQGKITITTNPKTKEKTVQYGQAIKGVKFVDDRNRPVPQNQSEKSQPQLRVNSLAGFKAGLKKIIEKQTKQSPSGKQKVHPKADPESSQKGGAK